MRTRNVVARLERLDWGELPPPGEKRPPTAFEQRRRETLQQARFECSDSRRATLGVVTSNRFSVVHPQAK